MNEENLTLEQRYWRAYYQEHKEARKASCKKWREKNKDKIRARMEKYLEEVEARKTKSD